MFLWLPQRHVTYVLVNYNKPTKTVVITNKMTPDRDVLSETQLGLLVLLSHCQKRPPPSPNPSPTLPEPKLPPPPRPFTPPLLELLCAVAGLCGAVSPWLACQAARSGQRGSRGKRSGCRLGCSLDPNTGATHPLNRLSLQLAGMGPNVAPCREHTWHTTQIPTSTHANTRTHTPS